ncbi:MAG: IS66 family transposase [Proteiniphilum sp.]|nr:IS66 family transposase [Proteiniphilum sp.]
MMLSILTEQLKAANELNVRLVAQVDSLNDTIVRMSGDMSSMKDTIASLETALLEKEKARQKEENISRGLSKIMGNKSEKQKVQPKESAEEVTGTAVEGVTPNKPKYDPKSRGNNGAKRNMHYELEEVIKEVYPDDGEFDADKAIEIGIRQTIRYKMIPPRFLKITYNLHSFKQNERIFSPKASSTPLLNSNYDGSFVAGIAQLRYIYSMPVERIVRYFSENGFEMGKAAANDLLSKTALVCENLYKALKGAVLEDSYIAGDETYHNVLIKDHADGERGIKKGYIWALQAMTNNLVYYFYEDGSRKTEVLTRALDGFTGTIQSDGWSAYKKLGVKRLACLQHCKRKFMDAAGNPDADKIVLMINELYLEDKKHTVGIDGWSEEDNLKRRTAYSRPILKRIKAELLHMEGSPEYPPKSIMYDAVHYMLNEWEGIEAIFTGGAYHLDNNAIERLNRYISLSRHNSLFFGSHKGAERGVIFYSLACSCRLNNINFFDYISDILNRDTVLQQNTDISLYRNFLPDKWNKQ